MALLNLDDFKKRAEPNFYEPVIAEFKFLQEQYGFGLLGSAVAAESLLVYTLNNVSICVFHVFPEPPFLILKKVDKNKSYKRKINMSIGSDAKDAVREMILLRDKLTIDEWCNQFRAGIFNKLINTIIKEYSSLVKNNIQTIINGDFSKF